MAQRLATITGHLAATRQPNRLTCDPTSAGASVNPGEQFKYTSEPTILTQEQRRFYEKNGFLVIRNLVPSAKLEPFRKRFEKICKEKIFVPGMTIMKDIAIETSEFIQGEKAVAKIQDFQNDDEMFEYCALPEVTKYASAIIGQDLVAIHTMFINKPPDSGHRSSRHPMHQDLHYFPFRPSDQIVCSWTAMQKVNRQNGCLMVEPGTHTGHLLPHGYPDWKGGVNKMYHGIQEYQPSQNRVYLEMEEGDTVFFHPILIHGSGTNRSQGFRKSISCHYASGKCYLEDVHQDSSQQKVIADEVVEIARKRLGPAADEIQFGFNDIWRLKSRVVQGQGFE